MNRHLIFFLAILILPLGVKCQSLFSLRPADHHNDKLISFKKGDDLIVWSDDETEDKKVRGKLVKFEELQISIKPYFKKSNIIISIDQIKAIKKPNYKRALPVSIGIITAGLLTSDEDTFLFQSHQNWAIPLGIYGLVENYILSKKLRISNSSDVRNGWEFVY